MDLSSPVARASLLTGLEGAALAVLGAAYAGYGVVGDPYDRSATVLAAGYALVAGVLVLLVARGLGRVAGWARSPTVVLQLLALPIGAAMLQAGVYYAAVPVLALSGATLYQLATPEARLAFRSRDTGPG